MQYEHVYNFNFPDFPVADPRKIGRALFCIIRICVKRGGLILVYGEEELQPGRRGVENI
jgi:hypothetical protein